MISQETIIAVREKAEIYDVVSAFLSLKKSGSGYKALSPFSNERTASFMLDTKRNFFKDFSSGKGGDCITFLMEHERMSFYGAIVYLAEKYKVEITYTDQKLDEREDKHQRLSAFIKRVIKHYTNLWESPEQSVVVAANFMQSRGFTFDEVKRFKISVCPGYYSLSTLLDHGSSDESTALELGVIKSGNSGKTYDTFANRVIFPVLSVSGKLVGFTARLTENVENVPKYLHLSSSILFEKSNHLYGLYWSRKKIIEHDKCYLLEGPMDYHAMVRNQFYNVVATLGTSVTAMQIKQVKRFTGNIVVMYDADKGGMTGAQAATKLCLQEGVMPSFIFLPEGEDPDSIIRTKGMHVMQQIMLREEDCATAILRISDYNQSAPLVSQQKSIKLISEILSASPHSDIRTILAQSIGKKIGMDHNVLLDGVSKIKNIKPDPSDSMVDFEAPARKDDRTMLEEKLAAILKYQYDSECYIETSEGWLKTQVWSAMTDWLRVMGVKFTDSRFTGLQDFLYHHGDKPETKNQVVNGLPAITEYGFYERGPVEMYGTILKIILDLAVMDAQHIYETCDESLKDTWFSEIVELQNTALGLYHRMKSIPA